MTPASREQTSQQVRVSQRGDRRINQDRCEVFQHQDITLMVLADGMGGHPKGEVAAQLLVDTAYHLLQKADTANFNAESFIHLVLQTAHRKILRYGVKQDPPIYPRTTAVLVVIRDNLMQWSHLGDSRTYLFRHGRAHMRTMDHTRAELMRLAGKLEDADSQAKLAGRSGVSRCLGGMKKIRNIEVTPAIRLHDGDILLLCSDGIWSQLKEARLEQIMLDEQHNLYDRVAGLVSEAVAAGAPHSDNATAMALCWRPENGSTASLPTAKSSPAANVADGGSNEAGNEASNEEGELDDALAHLRGLIDKFQ